MSSAVQQRSYMSYVPLLTPALQRFNCYEVDNELLLRRAAVVGAVALAAFPLIYLTAAKAVAGIAGVCLLGIGIAILDWASSNMYANENAFKHIAQSSGTRVNHLALHRMKHDVTLYSRVKDHTSCILNWRHLYAIRDGIRETLLKPLPSLKVYGQRIDNEYSFMGYYLDRNTNGCYIDVKNIKDLLRHPEYLHYVVEKGYLTRELCTYFQTEILCELMDLEVDIDPVFDVLVVQFKLDFRHGDKSFMHRLNRIKESGEYPAYTNKERVDELIKRFTKIGA